MELIDRDRLLSERMRSKYYHLPNGDTAIPIIDIENAPTVEPMQWIPCEVRLPEESKTYLCSCKNGIREVVTFAKWMPRLKSWNLTGSRAYWHVDAWCELPEPYGGDADGRTD